MDPYQVRNFQHNGRDHEIRIASDGHTIHVRAFIDGKPANGYSYAVEMQTQIDAAVIGADINPLELLAQTAEDDVRNGKWEQYLRAVAAHASGH